MRIVCPIHGVQGCILVSPDLYDQSAQADARSGLLELAYEYEGETVHAFRMSLAFARAHGIQSGVLPLPNDYPKWVDLLVGVCRKCFEEKQRNRIGVSLATPETSLRPTVLDEANQI
jgi:hypothetical protein